jgi:hypothetical protein
MAMIERLELTPMEWASLKTLSERPSANRGIPKEHEAKLVALGLVERVLGSMVTTTKGRRALLRR